MSEIASTVAGHLDQRGAESTWALPPEPAAKDAPVLSAAQIESWRERGFALVDGVVPDALLEEALADARAMFPEPGDDAHTAITDFGSMGKMAFPAESEAANAVTLHSRLLRAISQLLDTEIEGLRLSQSDLWPKYGRAASTARANDRDNHDRNNTDRDSSDPNNSDRNNSDQRIHVDYPNHTLVHPPRWDAPEAVEILLYLSDIDACGGATAVVPREGPSDPAYSWPIDRTPGVGAFPWINDRRAAEAHLRENAPEIAAWRAEHLYAREIKARYRFGTVLFYRHDTWHRGTPLLPGTVRFAHNMTFRLAPSEWISTLQAGWAWGMYRQSGITERLVAQASVQARCVLGFPAPGHAYWTLSTIEAVAARYGPLGIDMSPYREALQR